MRKEASKDRALKKQMELDDPGLYRHPSPFATNPHWQEEIDLGPHPFSIGRTKKTMSRKSRVPNSPEDGGIASSNSSLPLVQSRSHPHQQSNLNKSDSNTTLRKFQREDEDLWGSRGSRAGTIINGKGTLSRPPTAKTVKSRSSNYSSGVNPPINDLHPPIVTRLDSREDAMWMLQPPPSARVMSGKESPLIRTHRSDSGSSRLSSRRSDQPHLSRHHSRRTNDINGSSRELLPAIQLDPHHSSRSSNAPRVPRSTSSDTLSSDASKRAPRRQNPPYINVSEDTSAPQNTIFKQSSAPFDVGSAGIGAYSNGALHPHRTLSPINSENASRQSFRNARSTSSSPSRNGTSQHGPIAPSEKNQLIPPRRPALEPNNRPDSSLNVLQELAPSTVFNVRNLARASSFEARGIELPSPTSDEMELLGSNNKAGFENFYDARGFAVSEWVSERTKREVSSRWSMDF